MKYEVIDVEEQRYLQAHKRVLVQKKKKRTEVRKTPDQGREGGNPAEFTARGILRESYDQREYLTRVESIRQESEREPIESPIRDRGEEKEV